MTDSYSMDATALAAGMMFDTMAGTLGFNQGPSAFGGLNAVDQNTTSSMLSQGVNMDIQSQQFRSMLMDVRSDGGQHQPEQSLGDMSQQPPQVQGGQNPGMMYNFDSDTFAMWSNAPTGLE